MRPEVGREPAALQPRQRPRSDHQLHRSPFTVPPRTPACRSPGPSPPIAVALEVKPQLEDAIGKLAAEAVAVRVFPLAVDDLESDVLVGRPRVEAQDGEILVVGAGLQEVLGRGALVDEVGVEDVELVSLHDLGRWVVKVVVRLVVLVPLEARVHAVEEARLAWPVLVGPQDGGCPGSARTAAGKSFHHLWPQGQWASKPRMNEGTPQCACR
uniref:Putative uncharacterized protein encoded by CACTIN-AS1 n=1 Tax=Homo sapiens TaxID=9606 RepID=CAAS1_HUMAN|nr:RecName: Full=Putative uncharacterized protein encoded by CACTIN-AS1; AltName: Full=Cactin antisense RNA 1 [Homo sapiens]